METVRLPVEIRVSLETAENESVVSWTASQTVLSPQPTMAPIPHAHGCFAVQQQVAVTSPALSMVARRQIGDAARREVLATVAHHSYSASA